jgi:hypothetical protein
MGFKFERLEVWQKAIDFANTMFDIADALPQRYQFSLGEQLRRAALSISTNIAHKIGATRAWGMDLHALLHHNRCPQDGQRYDDRQSRRRLGVGCELRQVGTV